MFRCCFSHSEFEDRKNAKISWTKFQLSKLLTSLALPLAVALFTLITTIKNRQIAEQDLKQSEDDQRQNVFLNYINDISHYRDKYSKNLTNNSHKLLYIWTKTLTTLRKLDNERTYSAMYKSSFDQNQIQFNRCYCGSNNLFNKWIEF
jgi:hypothetical protein